MSELDVGIIVYQRLVMSGRKLTRDDTVGYVVLEEEGVTSNNTISLLILQTTQILFY